MSTLAWIRDTLRSKGIEFEELHHAQAFTAQEVAQKEHISGHRVAKVVVAMADGQPVELVLPASRRVVLDRLRDVLGTEDVRLATESEMAQYFTDCDVGAVPPLDHWSGVPIIMDESMRVEGDILFQAGTHEDAVRLRFDDWFRAIQPRVASFSAPAEAVPVE